MVFVGIITDIESENNIKQLLNNNNIDYDLILSIRSEDLKENSVTINSIVKFIKELKPMYHIEWGIIWVVLI